MSILRNKNLRRHGVSSELAIFCSMLQLRFEGEVKKRMTDYAFPIFFCVVHVARKPHLQMRQTKPTQYEYRATERLARR